MKRVLWIVLGWLALSLSVQAASFDCKKAQTTVEKMICVDAGLSKLDEELNAAYKTALQNEKQANTIKQAQKQWMKERNGCADAVCVKSAYEVRLNMLQPITYAAISRNAVATPPSIPPEEIRYEFKLEKDTGWNVCRDYVKNLESMQPTTESLACEAKLDPKMKQFSQPDWEELNIEEYWDVVYTIEANWERSPAKKIPPLDTWRESFRSQMKSGEIKPRLRRAVFKLPSKNFKQYENQKDFKQYDYREDAFFAYTRNRDNIETCKKEIAGGLEPTNIDIIRYTGDILYYLDPTSNTFQYVYPDTGTTFSVNYTSRVVLHNSSVYLQRSFRGDEIAIRPVIEVYRIFSYKPTSPGMQLNYFAQRICKITAHPISTSRP